MNKSIFCDFGAAALDAQAHAALKAGTQGWDLAFAAHDDWCNTAPGEPDARMRKAAVLFGQPDPRIFPVSRAHWIQLTSAGYGRYQQPAVKHALVSQQIALTTSSGVYAEPCAEHLLGMMLAMSRRLPQLVLDQQHGAWRDVEHRRASRLLVGQSVLLLGFGQIARRLTELLAPFSMEVVAIRRHVRGDEPVAACTLDALPSGLSRADHVVSTLPGNGATRHFMNAERFRLMKPSATFYNVGRGSTVDQSALLDVLRSGGIAGAYLDVTDKEPLPTTDPLWTAPRCFITPHSAGGFEGERLALVRHFVANFGRHVAGAPLIDRVI